MIKRPSVMECGIRRHPRFQFMDRNAARRRTNGLIRPPVESDYVNNRLEGNALSTIDAMMEVDAD